MIYVRFAGKNELDFRSLSIENVYDNIFPSLTVERVKRGYKPSKYGRCSFFRPCIDMCYILSLSKTFVFLMRVRMEVLVMIS